MRSYSLLSSAKINLYLEILGDRPDQYHELAMIMQSVDLADKIDVKSSSTDKIRVTCDDPRIPNDHTNLAYRAAALMAKNFPDDFANYGVEIHIEKRIPMAAGLAGGSSNAAAVLVGIDLLWNLGLTQDELQNLSAQLGSDIPFCISGGTAIATGRGEILDPLLDLDHLYVVLAKYDSLAVSTPWAYQSYRKEFAHTYISDTQTLATRKKELNSGGLVTAIAQKDSHKIGQLMHNDLEKIVLPHYPQVAELKTAFTECDTLGAMMSGSGPTVFALAETKSKAEEIKQQVRAKITDPDLKFWVAKFTTAGIKLLHE